MERTMRTFHARLISVWDQWVVEVPDAGGVHAMVTDRRDAEEIARHAVAHLLGLDPGTVRVIVEP